MVLEYDIKVILPRLSGALKEIVESELAAGNSIAEISSNWPMKNVNVWFYRPLTDRYKAMFPELSYEYLNDPKNWREHYLDVANGAMVAAKF